MEKGQLPLDIQGKNLKLRKAGRILRGQCAATETEGKE